MEYSNELFDQFDQFLEFFKENKKNDSKVRTFHEHYVNHKNDQYINAFTATDFPERILLLPQCIRNVGVCKAYEDGFYYSCQGCGRCAADAVIKKGAELGYKGVFILKGGRAVREIIKNRQPQAILGVSCWYEGFLGIIECESHDVTVVFYPLLKDGCVHTEVNIEGLLEFMEKNNAQA